MLTRFFSFMCFLFFLTFANTPAAGSSPAICGLIRTQIANAETTAERDELNRRLATNCSHEVLKPRPKSKSQAPSSQERARQKNLVKQKLAVGQIGQRKRNNTKVSKGDQPRRAANLQNGAHCWSCDSPQAPYDLAIDDTSIDALAKAIELVTEGGTITLMPGRYSFSGAINKRVTITGQSSNQGVRPRIIGRIFAAVDGIKVHNIDLELSSLESSKSLVHIPSGITSRLEYVTFHGENCAHNLGQISGLLQVEGTATLKNVNILAGNCFAVGINQGVIASSLSATWLSTADPTIVQFGGRLNMQSGTLVGDTVLNIYGDGEATFSATSITAKQPNWFRSQDNTGRVFFSGDDNTVSVR